MSTSYSDDLQSIQNLNVDEYFKTTSAADWSFNGFLQFGRNGKFKFEAAKYAYTRSLDIIKNSKHVAPSLKTRASERGNQEITRHKYQRQPQVQNINNIAKVIGHEVYIDSTKNCFETPQQQEVKPRQQQEASPRQQQEVTPEQQQEVTPEQQQEVQPQQQQLQQEQQQYEEDQIQVQQLLVDGGGEYSPCYVDSNSRFCTMTPESFDQFKHIYNKMDDSLKWKLNCTGRFVEDVLYSYGLTLKKEHCLHSFIMDTDDDDICSLFDRNEWEEIQSTNVKEDPPLPENVVRLLHDLNKVDFSAVYKVLKDSERRYEDFNTRAIFYAVDSILFLLEANPNPLMSQQLEQWYQANIWTPVTDKMLGDLPGVVCVLGESASVASKERKRQQGKRLSGRMGSRTDMILRKTGNGVVLEYGGAEVAANYDGTLGKKRMHEAELKLPKTLKDMMTILCNDSNWDAVMMRNMEVIGYCHSGTVAEFMVMDNPSGYICRLLRSNYYQVPSTIAEFSKLLTLLAASLRMKLRISRSIDSMNKLSLDLDSTMVTARKRKASKNLADTLTTPLRPTITSYQKKKRNPYLHD